MRRFLILTGATLMTVAGCDYGAPDIEYTFESGVLDPWELVTAEPPGYNTSSGAVVQADLFTPEVAPPGGQYMAYVTTLINEGVADFGTYDVSPDIDVDGAKETEYSALRIVFETVSSSTVKVDLNFLSQEINHGSPPFVNDADVFGISTGSVQAGPYLLLLATAESAASYTGTADPLTPADFSDEFIVDSPSGYATIADSSQFNGQTGFRTYSFPVGPGTHTWTFFVADSHTDGVASAMLIDNFVVGR